MHGEPIEDEDDVFIENLNSTLLLLIAVLSVSASAILLVFSATEVVLVRQLPTDLTERAVFLTVFLVVGFGSVHIFRKRRESRRRKNSQIFFKTKH